MENAGSPIIEAQSADVFSAQENRVLVSAVNWKISPGEHWIVGGAHGAGKTDLLMTVAGLHPPSAGVVLVFGREMAILSESETLAMRRRIGFVFKNGGRMFADLTVAESIALALCYHRGWGPEQAAKEVETVLELTGLNPVAGDAAQGLRTDWLQRVGLARALVLKPEILFLDEPAAGLEPKHRQWWQSMLSDLAKGSPYLDGRKMTVVAATNDFDLWPGETYRYAALINQELQVVGDKAALPELD